MKRTVCLLLAAVMLFGMILTSCNTLPEIPKDEVLFENDEYILERKDGVCRLNFKNGNEKDEIREGGCILYSRVIGFIGMDQLMAAYRNGFSEWALFTIRNFFPRLEDGSISVKDPATLCIPASPEGWTVRDVSLYGDEIFFQCFPTDDETIGFNDWVFIFPRTEEYFRESFLPRFEEVLGEEVQGHPEHGGRAQEYVVEESGVRVRFLYYSITEADKTLYVIERYLIDAESAPLLTGTDVWVDDGGELFEIGDYRPSDGKVDTEWLLSWSLLPDKPDEQ